MATHCPPPRGPTRNKVNLVDPLTSCPKKEASICLSISCCRLIFWILLLLLLCIVALGLHQLYTTGRTSLPGLLSWGSGQGSGKAGTEYGPDGGEDNARVAVGNEGSDAAALGASTSPGESAAGKGTVSGESTAGGWWGASSSNGGAENDAPSASAEGASSEPATEKGKGWSWGWGGGSGTGSAKSVPDAAGKSCTENPPASGSDGTKASETDGGKKGWSWWGSGGDSKQPKVNADPSSAPSAEGAANANKGGFWNKFAKAAAIDTTVNYADCDQGAYIFRVHNWPPFRGEECTRGTHLILEPDSIEVDKFWRFNPPGDIEIYLSTPIRVSGITIKHAATAPDVTTAPKEFELFGTHYNEKYQRQEHFFGRFTFNEVKKGQESFPVQHSSDEIFSVVRLRFQNNHGHSDFVDVYRVEVHGSTTK